MRRWTEEDEAVLRQMVEDRRPYREIAARLGRSWCAVATRVLRLGLGGEVAAAPRAVARDHGGHRAAEEELVTAQD